MQYKYNLEYGDSESITLSRAIEYYKKFVEEKLKGGAKSPYLADLQNIEKLDEKLSQLK